MRKLTRSLFKFASVLAAVIMLSSFACGKNARNAVDPEMKAEIESIEQEVQSLDESKKEIEEASAKVDSLLNDLEN